MDSNFSSNSSANFRNRGRPYGRKQWGSRGQLHNDQTFRNAPGNRLPVMQFFRGRGRYTNFNNCNLNENSQSNVQERKFDYWCDPCDRGFNTEEQLNIHNNEHQKCGIDGCSFTAHVNVVTKHIQMQHSTGLYKKICKTDTPEDIEKWIRERKKNYPSRENIEKKKLQEKECFERGEKLKDDKSRFARKNDRDFKHKNKRSFSDRKGGKYAQSTAKRPRVSSDEQPQTSKTNRSAVSHGFKDKVRQQPEPPAEDGLYCNLKAFKGTSQLMREDIISDETAPVNDNLDIEDEEWKYEETVVKEDDCDKPLVCNALVNLISAYDSSDDEGPVEEKYVKETNDNTNNEVKGILNDNKPKEEKIESDNSTNISKDQSIPEIQSKRARKHKGANNVITTEGNAVNRNNDDASVTKAGKPVNPTRMCRQIPKRRYPKTLLEKLLEKDIRHERNVILQCVHYIVQKNFFKK